jgi:hypothetical protein
MDKITNNVEQESVMETTKDIINELRHCHGLNDDDLQSYADRLEAARKREADSIHHAMVLIAGIEMENPEDPPRLWTALEDAWDALCDALGTDGDVSADVAEAKAIGRHFVVKPSGNAAKMREALASINCIDTRGLKYLLYELVEADIFDGGQINKTVSAVERAKRALSAPPRNCDRYLTPKDAMLAHLDEVYEGEKVEFGDYEWCEFIKWLFAEAEEENK